MTDTGDKTPYKLLDALDTIKIPAGSNLLITAPEPAGTEFLMRLLGQGHRDGEDLLVLTADAPSSDITADINAVTGGKSSDTTNRIRIIDCQTEAVDTEDESVVTQDVNTPRNLTDIGIGFKDAFDEYDAAGIDRVRFGLISLSVILSYVDQETVYRFCQTLTRGVEQEDALGLFLLNIDAHDEGTINTLKRAFDGVVRVESMTDELTVHVSGLDAVEETTQVIKKC